MDKYKFTVKADKASFSQRYSNEELKFLTGDGCPEIPAFRSALGLWDNFRVSTGMDTKAWVTKDRQALTVATLALRDRVLNEWDLFSKNYSFKAPGSRSRSGTKCWIGFSSGEVGFLMARHSGQLYFDVAQPERQIIDLRKHDSLPTVDGIAYLYRKPNGLRWPQFFDALAGFLVDLQEPQVRIRHDFASSSDA
ncbi:MAG TPA: hypothetical protein VNZ27_07580 [Rhodanobacter sp.]|jgi:hypothetical protein|nr:hypothetical protein [Rhodanobacter sp.]